MESMKKFKILYLISIVTFSLSLTAKSNFQIKYYNNFFGNVHQNPSRFSTTLTTISCGHPIKIYRTKETIGEEFKSSMSWSKVKVGPYTGYIKDDFLDIGRPYCFQDVFPKFFDLFEMDLTELYYWGKLYDQYIIGKSRIR